MQTTSKNPASAICKTCKHMVDISEEHSPYIGGGTGGARGAEVPLKLKKRVKWAG